MKRTLAVICAFTLLFLSACSGGDAGQSDAPSPGETENSAGPSGPAVAIAPTFTADTYPRVDGSTATIPLAEALAALMLGIDREAAAELVNFNGTTQSYSNLMYGQADLLLSYEESPVTLEQKSENNFEWEKAAIGRDALVIIVNDSNPVKDLTTQQIVNIYTGKIKNWKELGGNDVPIEAFQRNETSGSQTMFDKLIMKDNELMKPPVEYMIGEMDMLIEAVAQYNNSGAAIGYSVYYYAKNMNPGAGLRFLSVDGVEPTKETIKSGEYPHVNDFFAVIAKDAPQDSSQRKIFEWLQSEQGQKLVDSQGYVPVN